MSPRTMRHASLVVFLGAILFLTLASNAFASKWAYVQPPTSYTAGVRADIYTPSSSLSGIPVGTTVKAAVWLDETDYDDWGHPNAGWLIIQGSYSSPKSYYVYTDYWGDEHVDLNLSNQSYGVSRAYEIYHNSGITWSIKVVGDWRSYTYMASDSPGYERTLAGGKTSADNANLWGHLTTVQYRTSDGGTYYSYPASSSTTNASPLLISIINSKYNFNVFNDNYW